MTSLSRKATSAGLAAIFLWSMSIGLIRQISEHFGPTLGAALIYSGSACLLCIPGCTRVWAKLPGRYLYCGGFLFVSYEIALAMAIGLAHSRTQAVELGMINYLWPSLTVLLAIPFNRQVFTRTLWPGILLTLFGLVLVISDSIDWSSGSLWHNMTDNPTAYGLAFYAAGAWALYNNVTRRWAEGTSGVSLFFVVTAIVLWINVIFDGTDYSGDITWPATGSVIMMACTTALAYSGWNRGMQYGSLPLLSSVSYFTPVLSALLATLLLGLVPSLYFCSGVLILSLGSLVCWKSLR